jgi:hypothetical protein
MKAITVTALVLALAACGMSPPPPAFEGEPFGEALTLSEITPVDRILAAPDDYVGQRVLIEGDIVDVCDNRGCWMDIETNGAKIQVKVEDGVIVFPTTARGKTALVEGTVERVERTAEQAFAAAAHRAEEQGLPFDSTAVYAAETVYRIRGIGALIRS